MTPAEKDFYRLLAVLASEGVFNGRERDGVVERIVAAFEVAIEAQKSQKPLPSPEGKSSGLGWTAEEDWLR